MAGMVQCADIAVCDSLFQPDEEDERRLREHRDYSNDKLGVVLTLKLAKSIEHCTVQDGEITAGLV
jgi:hypothetical protein